MVGVWFAPESPVYLCYHEKYDDARAALHRLRGPTVDVEPELKTIIISKEEHDSIGYIGIKELLTKKIYLIPFLFGLFGFFNFQISGVNIVFFYTQTIFLKAGSTIAPGNIASDVFKLEIQAFQAKKLRHSSSNSSFSGLKRA